MASYEACAAGNNYCTFHDLLMFFSSVIYAQCKHDGKGYEECLLSLGPCLLESYQITNKRNYYGNYCVEQQFGYPFFQFIHCVGGLLML